MTPLIFAGFGAIDRGGNYMTVGKNLFTCYAYSCYPGDRKYTYNSYSGTYNTLNGHSGTKIGYCGHREHDWSFFESDDAVTGEYFPALTNEEMDRVTDILTKEAEDFADMIKNIAADQTAILRKHTPEALQDVVGAYCPHITLYDSVGWFGAAAVNTGALKMPAEDEFTGVVAYKK